MPDLSILHGCATIQLTKGQNTLVDERDWPILSTSSWFAVWSGHHFYAGGCVGPVVNNKRTVRLLHRHIVGEFRGDQIEDLWVDHKNLDTLDNRRENLRPSTRGQNLSNARKKRGSAAPSSQFKGVTYHKRRRKWRAVIVKDNRQYELGFFGDEREAAAAYDKAAAELHGEFALTNGVEWTGESTRCKGSSGYRGVFWCKTTGRWIARLRLDGRVKQLGAFRDETDAARAYNKGASEAFGDTAKLNEGV